MSNEPNGLPEAGAFSTSARSIGDFFRDLTDWTLNRRQDNGTVASSVGVTKPYDSASIEGVDDFIDITNGWTRERKEKRGGMALDKNTTHPNASYRKRRYDFVSEAEGIRLRAYDDKTGAPVQPGAPVKGNVTVGVGFNMDAPGNLDDFLNATGKTKEEFEKIKRGEAMLSKEDARKLFDYTIREAEDFIKKKFEGVELSEHQRIALVSLAFNNPSLIGPELTKYVREGNVTKARDEILHRSNRGDHRGIANRRYQEAAMFVGPTDAQLALPAYKDYIKDYA